MKTKFLKVLDSGTEMSFLLIQFQESEKEFLKGCGKSTKTKILLNLSDHPITCISGYDLNERHGNSIENLTKKMTTNGTLNGLKEIVHQIPDISYLPDILNVKEARWAFNHTRFDEEDELTELLDQIYQDEKFRLNIEKAMFKDECGKYLMIIKNIDTGSIIYESTSFASDQNEFILKYLWVPVNEMTDLNNVIFHENNFDRISV